MQKQRLYELDLIKLVAMLAVFTIHFTKDLEGAGVQMASKIMPDYIFNIYLGGFGVSLFFIVSGASLMYVYGESGRLKSFYKKRFLSIYPMFWMAFFISTAIQFFRYHGINETIPKWKIIYSILGIDGNALWWGPNFYQVGEWFLGVIICLYLIFPLLRKMFNRSVIFTVVASGIIYVICILFFNTTLPIECFFLARVPEFLFGMLFIKYRALFKKWAAVGVAALAIALICIFPMESIHVMIRILVVGTSSFIILAKLFSLIPFDKIKCRLLSTFCSWGGKYNYAFFLTHHFIIVLVASWFAGSILRRSEVWLLYFSCLAITAICTWLLYKLHKNIMSIFGKKENKIIT